MADPNETPGSDNAAGSVRAVAAWLSRRLGCDPAQLDWAPVAGGQTNRVWRVSTGPMAVFVKLYVPGMASRMFPNLPGAEVRVLRALSGTGLAPRPLAAGRTSAGRTLVLAEACGTLPCRGDRPEAARAIAAGLARLHAGPCPSGFRRVSVLPRALREAVRADLSRVPDAPGCARVRTLVRAWSGPVDLSARAALLHGDPVPGNTLVEDTGRVTLIDWQCPALGDPVHDLAIALSPGMRWLYGATPWTDAARAAFWDAYGDPAAQARHRAWAPLLAARIAAHFLAQAARGRPGYAAAADVELAALEA